MNPASTNVKVSEIFMAAGQAFSKLGEMCMQLHPTAAEASPSSGSTKWTDEEIEMLRTAVARFGDDLSKISEHIKTRTVAQIKQALKKKTFEESGIAYKPPVEQKSPKKGGGSQATAIAAVPTATTTPTRSEPPAKRQRTDVPYQQYHETDNNDTLVDIEGLEGTSSESPIKHDINLGVAQSEQDQLSLDSGLMMSPHSVPLS